MKYTELTIKALNFAYEAHKGQVDKGGLPYIFHPYAVAEYVSQESEDEYLVCAALLHDVVEDTEYSIEDLEKLFPLEVTDIIRYLTHKENTSYKDYIKKIKENEAAVFIKKMDIKHNTDETRFAGCNNITEEDKLYFRKKYEMALKILE